MKFTINSERIGAQGIEEILVHPWFNSIDWEKLEKKELGKPNMFKYVPITIIQLIS